MNKKANEQFKSNEKRMMDIFMNLLEEKDIRKITVREICESVQINRSTFYNHFLDVYDMLDKMMESHTSAIEKIFSNGRSKNAADNLRLILEYMKDHKILYRASFHSPGYEKMLKGFKKLYLWRYFPEYETANDIEKKKIEYQVYFIEQGMLSLVSYWLDHDCELEIESLIDVIVSYAKI